MPPTLPDTTASRAAAGIVGYDGRGGDSLLDRCDGLAAATLVETASVFRPIAAIGVGDEVVTAEGVPCRVLWRRVRRADATALARNPALRPVVVAAGALGPGLPDRTLTLAPDQAVGGLDGAARAAWLVDGITIRRDSPADGIAFVTLGLEGRRALRAAGVACPAGACADGAAAVAVRRRAAPPGGALQGVVEEVEGGMIAGWARDAGRPDAPVALELAADGEVIARTVADRSRPDLDMAGLGACAFRLRFEAPPQARLLTLSRAEDGADLNGSPILLPPPTGSGASVSAAAAAASRPIDAASLLAGLADTLAFTAGLTRPPSRREPV